MTAGQAAAGARTVLFVVGGFEIGGTERHLSLILPRLDRQRWRPVVRCLGPDGPFSAPLREANIDLATVTVRAPLAAVPKVRAVTTLLAQAAAVRHGIQALQPAVVHCFLPTPCIVGGLACRGRPPSGPRLVMSRRGQAAGPAAFPGAGLAERLAMRGADRVLAHSRAVLEELAGAGVRRQRLVLLPNGIDAGRYRSPGQRLQVRAERGWSDHETVIVCVANLLPYKGHRTLLKALAEACGAVAGWRLLLVGGGQDGHAAELRGLAAQTPLAGRVEFLGHRQDLAEWLCGCDIGVLASEHEGFSNAILEYMAAGLPVVATDVGGNRDAVIHGRTGLLAPVNAAGAIGQALRALVDDAEARRAMGAEASARVIREYDIGAIVKRYDGLYEELAGSGQRLG